MIKDIYNKLKEDGLNPYWIGQYKGLCRENYVIVKEDIQIPSIKTNKLGQKRVDIILYIPNATDISYSNMSPYAKNIRSSLSELEYLRKTGHETPAITDSDKEAYTMSIEYVLQKKLEG